LSVLICNFIVEEKMLLKEFGADGKITKFNPELVTVKKHHFYISALNVHPLSVNNSKSQLARQTSYFTIYVLVVIC